MAFTDKTLVCGDCGREFTFTTGEQEFYSSRGLLNEPKRCPDCRAARRRDYRGGSGGSRQSHSVICAECGVETTVPFEPTEGRPVYCKECYAKMKQSGDLDTGGSDIGGSDTGGSDIGGSDTADLGTTENQTS